MHSDIPFLPIDEPVEKISAKNGTEPEPKNNCEFIFSCVFQVPVEVMWLLFPEMALGEKEKREKKRKGKKKNCTGIDFGNKCYVSWKNPILELKEHFAIFNCTDWSDWRWLHSRTLP